MSISGNLRDISSQSSIASSPEMKHEVIGESLFENEFGGLSTLMYSDKELADSLVVGANADHWTMSTKSENEEERSLKISLHLKQVKRTTAEHIRSQIKTIAEIEKKAKTSFVQISLSKVER